MAIVQVLSEVINSESFNQSNKFTNGVAFFITFPFLTDNIQIEIDCYLQIHLTNTIVRLLDFNKVIDNKSIVNIIDSESIIRIPSEFIDTGTEMSIVLIPSEDIFNETFILTKDFNLEDRLKTIEDKIDLLLEKVDDIEQEPIVIPLLEQQMFFLLS